MEVVQRFQALARRTYQWLDSHSGGVLRILHQSAKHFNAASGSHAAAGLAYYAFFSLFPLLLLMTSLTGVLLADDGAQQQALQLIHESLPVSPEVVERNLEQVLASRGTVRLIGAVTLLWSASGFFNTLAANINRAWNQAPDRGFLERRLVAFAMVSVLFVLLILSLLSFSLAKLLPTLEVPIAGGLEIYETFLWRLGARLLPGLVTFALFFALYRWVPTAEVHWSAAVWGGAITAFLWEATKIGITYYLESDLVNYEVVYGSLGAVVALLFWIYISATIALFGAHLTAAIDEYHESAQTIVPESEER